MILNRPYRVKMRFRCFITTASCFVISIISKCQCADTVECRRQCSVIDVNPTCWEQSLEYYTQTLRTALVQYSGTLMYLSRWKSRNANLEIDLPKLLQDSIKRSLEEHHDDSNVLSLEELQMLFNSTIETAFTHEAHFLDEATYLPLFSCPLPCDYDHSMWRALAIVMSIAFVLACIAFFIYLCRHEHAWSSSGYGRKPLRR